MRYSKVLVSAFLATLILTIGATNLALASAGQTSGYVQYKVTTNDLKNPIMSTSAIINYSAQPTGQSGFVDLTIALSSATTNFTYSKAVNSSSLPEIFPYLTGLTNQSFSYQTQGISITANLVNTGQITATYNGTSYQATNYQVAITAENSSSAESFSANGNLTSLPSGIVNSAQLTLNQTTTVTVTLLSTNLSLNAPPASINVVGASMFGGAVIAVAAIVALTVYRRTKTKKSTAQTPANGTETNQENSKPSYGVD